MKKMMLALMALSLGAYAVEPVEKREGFEKYIFPKKNYHILSTERIDLSDHSKKSIRQFSLAGITEYFIQGMNKNEENAQKVQNFLAYLAKLSGASQELVSSLKDPETAAKFVSFMDKVAHASQKLGTGSAKMTYEEKARTLFSESLSRSQNNTTYGDLMIRTNQYSITDFFGKFKDPISYQAFEAFMTAEQTEKEDAVVVSSFTAFMLGSSLSTAQAVAAQIASDNNLENNERLIVSTYLVLQRNGVWKQQTEFSQSDVYALVRDNSEEIKRKNSTPRINEIKKSIDK